MTIAINQAERRSWAQAMWRGILGRCPNCGHGKLFRVYMKVAECCERCGEPMHHHRADDAPPYFTMLVVGHVVVPLMLVVEKVWHPDLWVHAAIWLPLTLIMTLALLPPVKGAIVGLQWAHRMHGFGAEPEA